MNNNKKYDLAVAYRIYPKVSKDPGIYQNDKLKLSEFALKSFKNSLSGLKVKMFVLLDNCPPEYTELFQKYFAPEDLELLSFNGVGNAETFKKQIEILESQNYSENIYFAEDDYFYKKNGFGEALKFFESRADIHFLSLYDHLDYYINPLHNYKSEIHFSPASHWRTNSCTCLTFLTSKSSLKKARKILMTYTKKNYDASMWMSITKIKVFSLIFMMKHLAKRDNIFKIYVKLWLFGWRHILFCKRMKIWNPMPSLATHLENNYLAPTVDWTELYSESETGSK